MSKRADKERPVEVDDIGAELQAQVLGGDGIRAADLERLAGLRAGRAAGLERERARLAEELDETDPRIAAIDDRLALDRDVVEALTVELARARTEPEPVGDREWVLRGVVLGDRGEGVAGLVVSLHDEGGGRIEPLGHACTDDRGAFALRHQFDAKAKPQGDVVFVRVHDGDGKLLAVDGRPLEPEPGRADYVEVVLGAAPRDCRPPPDHAS